MQQRSQHPSSIQLEGRRVVLPIEIWHECFNYLSFVDHKNLSLACHLFRDICLRFIFKAIRYSFDISLYGPNQNLSLETRLDRLEESIKDLAPLARNTRIAPLVREFNLTYCLRLTPRHDQGDYDRAKEAYDPFVDAFAQCLPLFINLRVVNIKEFREKMDRKILIAMAEHPSLDEVNMESVRFGVHVLKQHIALRKLSISNDRWGDYNPSSASKRLDMFSGANLEYLSAWTAAYSIKLFRALSKQGKLQHLKHLSFCLNPADTHEVYTFLALCPNVEIVRIGFADGRKYLGRVTLPPTPGVLLPRLKSFVGPEVAAQAFVPGRPVEDVKIEKEDNFSGGTLSRDACPLFGTLALSIKPLKKLDVSGVECTKGLVDSILAYFPDLQDLALSLPGCTSIFPGKDPRRLALETVLDEKKDGERDEYLPEYFSKHLKFIHWAAHGRLALPREIRVLRLIGPARYYYPESDDNASDDDRGSLHHPSSADATASATTPGITIAANSSSTSSLPHENNFANTDAESGRVQPRRMPTVSKKRVKLTKAYSLRMALNVVHALSVNYPALQIVNLSGSGSIEWSKSDTGNWSYTRS